MLVYRGWSYMFGRRIAIAWRSDVKRVQEKKKKTYQIRQQSIGSRSSRSCSVSSSIRRRNSSSSSTNIGGSHSSRSVRSSSARNNSSGSSSRSGNVGSSGRSLTCSPSHGGRHLLLGPRLQPRLKFPLSLLLLRPQLLLPILLRQRRLLVVLLPIDDY